MIEDGRKMGKEGERDGGRKEEKKGPKEGRLCFWFVKSFSNVLKTLICKWVKTLS